MVTLLLLLSIPIRTRILRLSQPLVNATLLHQLVVVLVRLVQAPEAMVVVVLVETIEAHIAAGLLLLRDLRMLQFRRLIQATSLESSV